MLELKGAQEVLENTTDVLKVMAVPYWIDSGTLLGAYRDKNLILYDHDIDIRILPGGLPEAKMPILLTKLWDIGYRVLIQNYGKRAELICAHENKTLLDLKFAFRDDNWLWIYCWSKPYGIEPPRVHCYPVKFFENLTEIELLGRKYPAPSPIEEYLGYHYGNWREFKKRPEQADETDLQWDYMFNPPCAMSLEELAQARKGAPSAVKSDETKMEVKQ